MNLALDIGNTKIKWGLFDDNELICRGVFSSGNSVPSYLKSKDIKAVVFCASGNKESKLMRFLNRFQWILDIDKIPIPFKTDYQTPDTLGKDRVAAIAGASIFCKDQDLLIIDTGTCITFDFLRNDGVHKGGTISPGLKMRWQAMNYFTEKLPLINNSPKKLSPNACSTISAIEQGAFLGILYEIEGYISYFEHLYPKLKILITGGDAPLFVKFIKLQIFAEPNLVLEGLNQILKNYAAKKGWN